MATKTINDYHTLVELAKRTDPNGNSAELINILAENNPMLEEAHWEQANDLNSHEYTQVIELPAGDFGRINKGIAYSAGRTKQVVEVETGLYIRKERFVLCLDSLPVASVHVLYIVTVTECPPDLVVDLGPLL